MSREHILPEYIDSGLVRLRSEWQPGDADLIADLHARGYASEGERFGAAFVEHVRGTIAEARLNTCPGASRVWFAERDGEALGCAAMIDRGGRGQLRWVVLLPQARGRGIGKALFGAAMDYAGAQGWPQVYLETTGGLDASMNIYLANGFIVTSDTTDTLWHGPGRLIVMTRGLAGH